MNSSSIHDNICSLIHKKCHLKSNRSDIKYHTTLNITFSIVSLYLLWRHKFGAQVCRLGVQVGRLQYHRVRGLSVVVEVDDPSLPSCKDNVQT